jgi:hypothetical protein
MPEPIYKLGRDSSDSIVISYGIDDRGSFPGRDRELPLLHHV